MITQKEIDLRADSLMKEFMTKITDAINDFRCSSIHGPVTPLLERLEEARFWLIRCVEIHGEYLKEWYNEQEKEQKESSDKD